jgi:hypothetical protein
MNAHQRGSHEKMGDLIRLGNVHTKSQAQIRKESNPLIHIEENYDVNDSSRLIDSSLSSAIAFQE